VEVVGKFTYFGVVFSTGGSFTEAQKTLSGQALKAMFKMNKHLYKFTSILVSHRIELFDKLILPILNYASEVWVFVHGKVIERMHLQFMKKLLGVKHTTKNDFIYRELGRANLKMHRYYSIIKYWTKLLTTDINKYNNNVRVKNWCSLLKQLLCTLGFYEVWLLQEVGNVSVFFPMLNKGYLIILFKVGMGD